MISRRTKLRGGETSCFVVVKLWRETLFPEYEGC